PWPGNVRELENVIERAVILSAGEELEVPREVLEPRGSSMPARAAPGTATVPAVVDEARSARTLEEVERGHILAVLERTGWRIEGVDGAARVLRIHPSTLRSRMVKLGIRRGSGDEV
ncbi:MAG: helix-turn-helix domain-containing protein, partial [Candidatus Binatia bacterium]